MVEPLGAIVPAQTPPTPSADTATIERKASDILDVGDRRFIVDNYEQRMEAFAEEMRGLDLQGRASLFAEILRQDSGALNSWLTVDRMEMLVEQGHVTDLEQQAILEGFTEAYDNGDIGFRDAAQFIGFHETAMQVSIGGPQGLERVDAFLQLLQRSNSPAANEFVSKFAAEALAGHTHRFRCTVAGQ